MKKGLIITLTTGLILMSSNIVFAQTAKPIAQDRIAIVKSKADAEVDRRVASLNAAINLVNNAKKLNDTDKSNFVASINTQISALMTLKTKIDGDTDLVTLRADQKSIFNEYRIYLLYIPQTRILAAADRMSETADLMSAVATKLQTRIGGNTSLMNALNDANTKLADAKTQYVNADAAVTGLTPDGGDLAKEASNKQAILAGRNDLQAGLADLKAARADFQTIVTALKSQTPTATP